MNLSFFLGGLFGVWNKLSVTIGGHEDGRTTGLVCLLNDRTEGDTVFPSKSLNLCFKTSWRFLSFTCLNILLHSGTLHCVGSISSCI